MITNYDTFLLENNSWTEKDPEYYGISNYKWNNGVLDCYQNVDLQSKNLIKLPFNFGKVTGYFMCGYNKLIDLVGCPLIVNGTFGCAKNQLTSLKYGPEYVGDSYNCYDNQLIDLKYCPKIIKGDFFCGWNSLTDLKYCPVEVGGNFACNDNKLINLEYCPKIISGYLSYIQNNITDDIENYPISIIGNISPSIGYIIFFVKIQKSIKENEEKFIPLLDNKIAFHQMIMRLNPDLIQYYKTIRPPSKKTIL